MSAASSSADAGGHTRMFSGDDEDAKEYKRWKTWVANKLLTLSDKVPKEAHGAYVYTLLSGKALECVEHLDPAEYQKEDGQAVLFRLLDQRFPQKDNTDEMAEVLSAVFALKAAEGESLKTWVSRASELFDRCQRKCNVSFPEEARGWIVLRRSGLTEEQQAVVLARSLRVLKREEVSRAMRSCYPDFTAPRKRALGAGMVEDEGLADVSGDLNEPWDEGETFEDVEQFLAQYEMVDVENDDEPEIFAERDVADVMAVSWKEKRKEITKMQRNRRFSQAADLKRQFRVEVEEIKKKTRCHRCGVIGHWSRECKRPRTEGKGSGKGGASGSGGQSSSRKESGTAYVEHFVASVGASVTMIDRLRDRLGHTQANETQVVDEALLVSSPGFGVLDSGCGKSIMGQKTFEGFVKLWEAQGIPVPEPYAEINHFRFGNGQRETSELSVKAPVVLAGKSGVVRVALVKGEAPLLVSRKALQSLQAKLDFSKNELTVFDNQQVIPLQVNSAGQYVVPLLGNAAEKTSPFEEVMMSEATDANDPSIKTDDPAIDAAALPEPMEPTVSDTTGDHAALSKWVIDHSYVDKAITTGKQGPCWRSVRHRTIVNRDTGEVIRDESIDHNLGKHMYHQPLPKHVMHIRTTFSFIPEENTQVISECLSVRQLRQLETQVQRSKPRHEALSAGCSGLMVAEVFSPPRFSPVVSAQGFRAVSFDIKNGYDFTVSSVRRQVKEQLAADPPRLLVLCPPCTNEGGWFHLNSLTMEPQEVLKRKAQSRMFIRFCCELFRQQVELGGQALFEHPSGSRLWTYPEMLKLSRQYQVVKCHMCRFGLRLPGSQNFIRKSTKLLVSHKAMEVLGRTCPGKTCSHHVCHDVVAGSHPKVGAISKFAGQYTHAFVDAVLDTVLEYRNQSEVLEVMSEPRPSNASVSEVLAARTELQSADEEQVKKALDKLHRNLGHPANHDLIRVLKHGQASELALRLAREHTCDFCRARIKPHVPLPARTHRATSFNEQVGIDVKYLPGWKPNQKIKALNIVDQASCFQQVIPFYEVETSALLRKLYSTHWVAWAGPPKELILDPAPTNMGENLQTHMEFEGTNVKQIAAEAHWQLGRTENHGGWFARVLAKIMDEHTPTNREEWEECVRHAHIKNTMIQSYGFTPHQHVFGLNPNLPGDLLSEPLQVVPATAGLTEAALAKAQAIRQSAREAVIRLQDDKSLRRALSARPRLTQTFQAGDCVAYWRQQKYLQGQVQQGGRWHGTAIVIGHVGRNLILAHRRQIFRCAPEQVRPATTEEKTLVSSPQAELLGIKDLIEGGTFRSHQFVDLVPSYYPTAAEGSASESMSPSPSVQAVPPIGDASGSEVIDKSPAEINEGPTALSSNVNQPPEQEEIQPMSDAPPDDSMPAESASSQYGPIRRRVRGKAGEATMYRPPAMRQEDFVEVMREVIPHLIDENVAVMSDSHKRELEPSLESVSAEPAASRLRTASPETAERSTAMPAASGTAEVDHVHETLSVQQVSELVNLWEETSDVEVLIASYLAKKMSKELRPTGNEPTLQHAVDESKRVEWDTLLEKGAICFHFGKDAERIRRKHSDRFIGSRYVITRKPAQENGQVDVSDPSTYRVKSRWCLQGHLDPDLDKKIEDGLLQSPTLSQMGRNTLMQIIASHKWTMQLGDIKGAFLESGKLDSRFRPLYAKQPVGGVPGIPQDRVIEVLGNVYGQNDAPVMWYRTFDNTVTGLGWSRSKFDSCLYYLRSKEGSLVGIMGVHVDDTAIAGQGPLFESTVAQLKHRFPYRKWRVGSGDFCGAFYQQDPETKSISMSMQTFAESIKTAYIPKGVSNDQPLNESQIKVLRAINGSLNWLASQSRPDLAVQTSLSQQAFPNPCIRNLRDANNAVRRARQHKQLSITFPSISPSQLTICCHSDAAWANVGTHTQAGYVIAFTSSDLHHGREAPWVPVVWKSYRLARAVSSTLAGESQAMSVASGTVEWLSLLVSEALDGPTPLREVRSVLSRRRPLLATDCKSLYDHLVGPSSPTAIDDRRTSIDVVIIRESLHNLQGSIRWLPTDRMLADGLTKDKLDPADLLRSCVRSGVYQIAPETAVLARQAAERELRKARQSKHNNNTHESKVPETKF